MAGTLRWNLAGSLRGSYCRELGVELGTELCEEIWVELGWESQLSKEECLKVGRELDREFGRQHTLGREFGRHLETFKREV